MVRSNYLSSSAKLAFVLVFIVMLKLFSMLKVFTRPNSDSSSLSKLSEKQFLETAFDPSQNLDIDEDAEIDDETTDEMEEIISELRDQIERETRAYKLPSSRDVKDLIPEKGGTPMRSIVITTWRSGSTFIGGVLNSHPATFHFSEPLTDYRTVQIRGEPLASPAIRALHSLLTCNYNVLGSYLERSKEYTWLFTHNTRMWQHCRKHTNICWLPNFLTPVCKLFPFQSMKVVHIRLRLVEQLLADPKLNVRVVLLVRDPRGIIQSRSYLSWCQQHADCASPERLCADMVDDYSAALMFTTLFPHNFKVIRYEDMSLSPAKVIPDMFTFFGLQYHADVERYVKTHTTKSSSNRYSTFRNSSATAFLWRTQSSYSRVKELQQICRVALTAWGYLPAQNATHLRTFNPLLQPFNLP